MQNFATLIWGVAIFLTPFILLVASYYSYVNGGKVWDVLAKLFFAVLGYVLITAGSIPILFIAIFSSAHSTSGQSLEGSSLILFVAFAVLYVVFCYLLVSLAKGGFVKPWKLFTVEGTKEVSVFKPNSV
jgi:hypothetical protein